MLASLKLHVHCCSLVSAESVVDVISYAAVVPADRVGNQATLPERNLDHFNTMFQ